MEKQKLKQIATTVAATNRLRIMCGTDRRMEEATNGVAGSEPVLSNIRQNHKREPYPGYHDNPAR